MPDGANEKVQKGFRGYCTLSEFRGIKMPVPAQNLMLRDYARRRGLLFRLSVNELAFQDCFLQLHNLLDHLGELDGVLMSSMLMLPGTSKQRKQIYQKIIQDGAELHFVLENAVIGTQSDVDNVELILQLTDVVAKCPKTISSDLLPPMPLANFSEQIASNAPQRLVA